MPLSYLLDTNICIYIAKNKPQQVLEKFQHLAIGTVGMSVITYGELLYGAQKSNFAKQALVKLEQLSNFIFPIPLSLQVAKFYAEIRANLESKGKIIGNNDLWIAAHCLDLDIVLVTNNAREFSRVEGLKIENWVDS